MPDDQQPTAASRPRAMSGTEAKRLHREWRRRTGRPVAVLLDGVQTPYNVGSIVRTGASFKIDRLLIAGAGAVTPDHQKSRKTSLGTERLLPWEHYDDIDGAIASARRDDYALVGVELVSGGRPLHQIMIPERVCLVVGHEDRGLSASAIRACDVVGYVPTPGKVGSLNVAVALSIALYEVRRQEWTSEPSRIDLDP